MSVQTTQLQLGVGKERKLERKENEIRLPVKNAGAARSDVIMENPIVGLVLRLTEPVPM